MNSAFLGMTDMDVSERFGRLYDRYLSDEEAEEKLAEIFDVGPSTIRIQNEKRLQGAPITASMLIKMCWLIEKAQIENVPVGDPILLQHGSTLRRRALTALREDMEGSFEAREVERAQSEKENAERLQEQLSELRSLEEEVYWGQSDLENAKEKLAEDIAGLTRRERELAVRERRVNQPVNRRQIILEEVKDGKLLGTSATTSLLLAKLRLGRSRDKYGREEKEAVFNLLTAPVRGLLAILMP